jgi:hypothetical protein
MTEPSAGREPTSPDSQISLLALGSVLLRERGLVRASLFSWAETARRTRDVYRSLVDGA